jgi:hypothetical protein
MNFNCVLDNNGSNKYRTPHMRKEFLERRGILPTTIAANNMAANVPDLDELILDNNGMVDLIDEI